MEHRPDLDLLAALVDTGPTALFATVSGAHLYGFASADSDVDLRGSFVQSLADRCRLSPPPETVTISRVEPDVELDWVAHDVRKFCRLMTRRNGYVLEQLYSPLEVTGGEWLAELREIGRGCIVRHLHHHYRGFAATKRAALEKPKATVKDLLYLYRVYLTGIHVLRTGVVQSHLPTLLEEHPVEGVAEQIDRKQHGGEHGELSADEWGPSPRGRRPPRSHAHEGLRNQRPAGRADHRGRPGRLRRPSVPGARDVTEPFWETGLILRMLAGSRAHGLARPTSATDTRGVCIPPARYLIGLSTFEQHSDDAGDHVTYALAKFVRLALGGNPNIIEALYTDERHVLHCTDAGSRLRDARGLFLTPQRRGAIRPLRHRSAPAH